MRSRLESSWAHLFRCEVLPILLRKEDDYAMLYGKTGRPNFSVARLLGLCLLQEWNDLSDQEALDTFSFDVRWRLLWMSTMMKTIYLAVLLLSSAGD